MQYKKLTGIILKKQNYREADQIITIWTREAGKLRVMARGLRKPTSKLSYNLQDLSFISFEVAGQKNLPTIISSQTYKNYKAIRQDLGRTAAALVASELMLKMTADEQANPVAFDLLNDFFDYLDRSQSAIDKFNLPLQAFSLKLLSVLGFGFKDSSDRDLMELLRTLEFQETQALKIDLPVKRRLYDLVNGLVESVLERNLKSQAFLMRL